MVGMTGIEPVLIAEADFKSAASTNFATFPCVRNNTILSVLYSSVRVYPYTIAYAPELSMSLSSTDRRSPLLFVLIIIPVILALGVAVYYSHATKVVRANREQANDAFDLRLTVKDLQTAATKLGANEIGVPAVPDPAYAQIKEISASEQGYVELARLTMSLTSTNTLSPLDRERLQRINALAQAYITSTRLNGPAPLRQAMLADIERESELLSSSANERWRDLNRDANLYRNQLQSNVLTTLILLGLCLAASAFTIYRINEHRLEVLEALQLNTERRRAILESTNEAIFTVSATGIILSSNRAASRIFGWNELTLEGRHLTSILADAGASERFIRSLNRLQTAKGEDGERYASTGIDSDGCRFPVEITSSQVKSGTELDYVIVVADLTQHWRQPVDLVDEPTAIDV